MCSAYGTSHDIQASTMMSTSGPSVSRSAATSATLASTPALPSTGPWRGNHLVAV
jgi:hypothetical protein